MAGPGATVLRFEHWFPLHVLSSIRIRYGTYVSGRLISSQSVIFMFIFEIACMFNSSSFVVVVVVVVVDLFFIYLFFFNL